ncbi:MAG: hypothetical protein EX269_11935 [Acidimicrobiales bacterium]|nr:MAG: hypothetical protein EX269_11935 [Acidimicrobiales bacterium]
MRRAVLLVALLLLSACGSSQGDTSGSTSGSTTDPTVSTEPVSSSPTTATTITPPTTAATTTTAFDPTLELLSLTQARQRWADTNPGLYEWTYFMVCECFSGPWKMLIDNGQVLSVDSGDAPETEAPPFATVESLFGEIERVLEEGRFPVRVNYDEVNGVPSVYVFNEPDLPVDGGFIFELEHFEPNPVVEIEYPETCSTDGSEATLVEQDLPEVVAETRQAIFDAAMSCDFDALRVLSMVGLPDWTFQTSFGGSGVELFWEEEARGEPILQEVVNHFNQPVWVSDDGEFHVWPSAFQTLEAADGTGMDPDAYAQLLELYTVDELQDMIDFAQGYVGWRTTITADGVWTVFIAGD